MAARKSKAPLPITVESIVGLRSLLDVAESEGRAMASLLQRGDALAGALGTEERRTEALDLIRREIGDAFMHGVGPANTGRFRKATAR
jgi:hypothetical protein